MHGRNDISWEERFELDVEYVDNITLVGDIKIIFRTLLIVFKCKGISSKTCTTMEEFKGTPEMLVNK